MRSHHNDWTSRRIELVCGVSTLPALRAAVDNGASRVSFGLNHPKAAQKHPHALSVGEAASGIRYAHARRVRTALTLDIYPQESSIAECRSVIDAASDLGVDAIELADVGLMKYASSIYPSLPVHLSARAAAANCAAIEFHRARFAVKRALLPSIFTAGQIEHLAKTTLVELEVHVYGEPCVMAEGHCALSSYVTSSARSTTGVCTPASTVNWNRTCEGLECRVNDVLVDRYGPHQILMPPTPCSGCYEVAGRTYHAFEESARLDALELLPALVRMGIAAVRVAGRRGDVPHLSQVTRIWRDAIDMCWQDPTRYGWVSELALVLRRLSEGRLQPATAQYTRGR
jgi:putative protease